MKNYVNEIWKDINGLEGSYQISTYGRIKSLERRISSKILNNPTIRIKEKIIKQQIKLLGYKQATLKTLK